MIKKFFLLFLISPIVAQNVDNNKEQDSPPTDSLKKRKTKRKKKVSNDFSLFKKFALLCVGGAVIYFIIKKTEKDKNPRHSKLPLDNNKKTAWFEACKKGDIKEVKKMYNEYVVDLNAKDNDQTVLRLAANGNKDEVVKFLLDEGADVNATDRKGWTALHCASALGYNGVVEALLNDTKIDVNAKTEDQWTALHCASFLGYNGVVEALLNDKKIEVNATNNKGETALDLAENNSKKDVAQLLRGNDGKRSLDDDKKREWFEACKKGDIEEVKKMYNEYVVDLNAKDNDETVLGLAANRNKDEVVKFLLDEGADVNATDSEGWTALHGASALGYNGVVEALLNDTKIEVNAKTEDQWTALHFAASLGYIGVVKALLNDTKIDVNATNKDLKTALDLAEDNGKKDVAQLLREM